jgi:hypothetical protein
MKHSLFHNDAHEIIEKRIQIYLNQNQDFLSLRILQSTRAAGDALQEIIGEKFHELASEYCQEYSHDFARRSMADLAFTDSFGNYHVVDVKTHREDTKFNMPNLTSVERLSRFYEDDRNYFSLLIIKYRIEESLLKVTEVTFKPIEFLSWNCLTIGALGWGQIQIANSNQIIVNTASSRREWMIELCDTLLEFYPKEISKIGERIKKFESIKAFWLQKPDVKS